MRIGLTGAAGTADKMVQIAKEAEADGFSSLWYASATGGDPLVAMAMAGRATQTIEIGTAVLQTYTCHPVLQAGRAIGDRRVLPVVPFDFQKTCDLAHLDLTPLQLSFRFRPSS